MPFGCFSEDVAFAHHFVATHPSTPLSHSVEGVLMVLATPVKNYLKWWVIQLTIHSIADEKIDYK